MIFSVKTCKKTAYQKLSPNPYSLPSSPCFYNNCVPKNEKIFLSETIQHDLEKQCIGIQKLTLVVDSHTSLSEKKNAFGRICGSFQYLLYGKSRLMFASFDS